MVETRARLLYIRRAISEFDSTHGRLPNTLEEICPPGVECPLMPMEDNLDGFKDGWGTGFLLERVANEYEVRSAGPDKSLRTGDDIVFRPSVELARKRRNAGCYTADLSWWKEFPGGILVLDSTAIVPGEFILEPTLRDRYYIGGSWRLGAQDSVLLSWREIHSAVHIRLIQKGDSLVGTAYVPGHRKRDVVLYRTACP